MKNAAPGWIALLVAVIALAVALLRDPESQAAADDPLPVAASGIEALDRRVADLESELERLSGRINLLSQAPSERREIAGAQEDDRGALAARVAELEAQVAELRSTRPAVLVAKVEEPISREEQERNRARDVESWIQQGRNGAATEEELLVALRNLRFAALPDGTDARLSVLPQMIRLAESSTEESVRADVWRQLSGVTDRALIGPLLHALQNDPSAEVREEAAETLADFLPDPLVKSALEHAAAHDPDPGVRAQASESLGGRRR